LNWKLRRFRIDSWIVTREPHTASSRKRLFYAALVRVSLCDLHFLTEPDVDHYLPVNYPLDSMDSKLEMCQMDSQERRCSGAKPGPVAAEAEAGNLVAIHVETENRMIR